MESIGQSESVKTVNGINIIPARLNAVDAHMVMTWRNNEDTLKASYHSNPKQWPDFFAVYREYFLTDYLPPQLAVCGDEKIAFLRFRHYATEAGQACSIDINVAPTKRGQGMGTAVLVKAVQVAFRSGVDAVVAEIKTTNKASIRAFEKAGFTLFEEAIVTHDARQHFIYRYRIDRVAPVK